MVSASSASARDGSVPSVATRVLALVLLLGIWGKFFAVRRRHLRGYYERDASPSFRGSYWRKDGETLGAEVLSESPFVRVERHTVRRPDGAVLDDWLWFDELDHVNVVAELENGRFRIFNGTKYGIRGTTLATVGGFIEAGERPLDAAKRELLEEMTLESSSWVALAHGQGFRASSNHGGGFGRNFLARGCTTPGAERQEETEERRRGHDDADPQVTVDLSLAELRRALDNGDFRESFWALAVAQTLLHVQDAPYAGRGSGKEHHHQAGVVQGRDDAAAAAAGGDETPDVRRWGDDAAAGGAGSVAAPAST